MMPNPKSSFHASALLNHWGQGANYGYGKLAGRGGVSLNGGVVNSIQPENSVQSNQHLTPKFYH